MRVSKKFLYMFFLFTVLGASVSGLSINDTGTSPSEWVLNESVDFTVNASDGDAAASALNGTYSGETLHDGTINGASWTDGKYGDALSFDGSNDRVDAFGLPTNYSNMSVSMRVKPDEFESYDILLHQDSDFVQGYGIQLDNGNLRFSTEETSGGFTHSTQLNLSSYNHIAVSFSNTNVMLCVNGVCEDNPGDYPNIQVGDDDTLTIGRDSYYGKYFNGTIDTVSLYNRSLSSSEISDIYQSNKFIREDLVANWRMDSGSGGTAFDTHHRLSRYNSNSRGSGAVSFDGTDDYVNVNSSASISGGNKKITISSWIYHSKDGGTAWVLGKGEYYDAEYSLAYREDNSDFRMYTTDVNDGRSDALIPYDLPKNEWHHVTGVIDVEKQEYPNQYTLFVDGQKVGSDNTGISEPVDNSKPLTIGSQHSSGSFWEGKLDDVRLYNRTLSSSEINDIYTTDKPIQDGLQAWYTFDNATGRYADTRGKNILDYDIIPSVKIDVKEASTQIINNSYLTLQNRFNPFNKHTYKTNNLFTPDQKNTYYNATITATDKNNNQKTVQINQKTGYAKTIINSSVQINQTQNNAYINITQQINLSKLKTYKTATNFGGINWSITGNTTDRIDLKLSSFKDENNVGDFLANYSISTQQNNNVTHTFKQVSDNSIYQIFKAGTYLTQTQATTTGIFSYAYNTVTTAFENFAVQRTDNFRPVFTNTEYRLDEPSTNEQLVFNLNDENEADFSTNTGTGSLNTFTNSTLIYDVTLSVADTYTVTDFKGLTGERQVDISKISSGIIENTGFSHTLNTQGRKQNLDISNNDNQKIDYNWTTQFSNTFTGSIQPGNTVQLTDTDTGDFIINENESLYNELNANNSKTHNLTKQYILWETQLEADNNQGFKFTDVDISNTCENTVTKDVNPGTSTQITSNCSTVERTGDFINSLQEFTERKYSDADFDHGENLQRIHNQTKLQATNTKTYTFKNVDITSKCSETNAADIPGGTNNVTNNCNKPLFTGDFITQNVGPEKQDETVSSNLSKQFIYREKNLTENAGYNFSNVNVSAPSISGDIQNGGVRKVDVDKFSTVTQYYNSSSDFLSNQSFKFRPESGSIVLGFNYTGTEDLEVDNSLSTQFSNVSTVGGVGKVQACTQTNNTKVSIGSNQVKNYTVEFSCNPGNKGSPVQTINSINSLTDRVWYNSTDMEIKTNETESNNFVIRADKDNLKTPNERDGGTLKGYVEGVSTENSQYLSIQDTGSFFRIEVMDGFQNSSLHTDDSEWGLTYVLGQSGTGAGGGGGGGDIDESESQVIYFGEAETEEGIETVSVPFGEPAVRNMTVVNERQSPTSAKVSVGDTGLCQFVSVQKTLNSDQFSKSGTYDLPAATQTLGTVESSDQFRVRYNLPNQTVLEDTGVTDYSCEFETSSSYGTAEPLNIQVEEGFEFFGLFGFLQEKLCFEVPVDGVSSNLTGGEFDKGGSTEFCLSVWQLALLLSVLGGGLYFVLRSEDS